MRISTFQCKTVSKLIFQAPVEMYTVISTEHFPSEDNFACDWEVLLGISYLFVAVHFLQ